MTNDEIKRLLIISERATRKPWGECSSPVLLRALLEEREKVGRYEGALREFLTWAEGFAAPDAVGAGAHLASWPAVPLSAVKLMLSIARRALSGEKT